MPYIAPEVIQQAKQIDLLTYLQQYEPNELVKFSADTYTTKSHDSLKISNGKWMWWSRGIGGKNAIDYLVKVKGLSFVEAVETVIGKSVSLPIPQNIPKENVQKELLLPDKNSSANKVMAYLLSRGIDREIIEYCIENGFVFESLPYHNAVFIGKDEEGIPKYAAYRATNNSRIMGDASGSDKHYSFRLEGTSIDKVHLFECAIDVLSYATLIKLSGGDWRNPNLISLAGVYSPKEKIEESKVPVALEHFLKTRPNIKRIYLHLDNDKAGRLATEALKIKLKDKYEIVDNPPKIGKDYNDFLLYQLQILQSKKAVPER